MASMVNNFLAGLSAREKKMVALLGVSTVVMICFLVSFLLSRSIDEMETNQETWKDLIKFVEQMEMSNARAAAPADLPMGKPRPLRTLVDQVVARIGISEPDTKELNEKTSAGGWLERSVEVSFREIDLTSLVMFMEEVEKNRRMFPIAITHLDIRQQRRVPGQLRVTMTITTYEKTAVPSFKKGKGKREAHRD